MVKNDYGIVANVCGSDKMFRPNAKAWLCDGTGGEGWERFKWRAISHRSNVVEKWSPITRFKNFRAAWVPPALRDSVCYFRGSHSEMEDKAKQLETFAEKQRSKKDADNGDK